MRVKFSEDLVPLTDLKANPRRVVKHTTEAHRPVLLTSRGKGVAIVQSLADYEKVEEEQRVAGLPNHPDIGRVVPEFSQPFLRELIHPPFRIV